ncbi:MAG: nitrogenase-stabilizing/protective protein NifW [Rhodocyclaceae bacterium]|nr:nitrogenase-stabilizing/protective protein NifW [Rhodocyclaceae bacterium]
MNRCADFRDELSMLESAEDFFEFFDVSYEPSVVEVNRLQILKRLHDYLEAHRRQQGEPLWSDYKSLLQRAYQDFVDSDACTQKAMRVHQRAAGLAFVPLSAIRRRSAL